MALLHLTGIALIALLLIVGGYYARTLFRTRREAGLAILEREQRFRCLAEATFEGIIVHRDGAIVDANAEFSRMFGHDHASALGLQIDALLTNAGTGAALPTAAMTAGIPLDLIGHHQDGTTFPVEARGRLYRSGDTAQITAIRDVSAREAAARALRESESRLRSLVDTVGSVIVLVTIDYRILEWNHAAERLYGLEKAAVLGHNYLEEFTTPATRSAVAAAMKQVVDGEERWGFEYAVAAADGSERVVRWNLTRLQHAEATTAGLLACGQDITEITLAHTHTLAALRAKEILLQEVYHRVKNNLQVVDSLLNRQAAGLQKPMRVPLLEAQSRIRSLAAIHELLYQADDLERIDFSVYVRRLAAELMRSHGFDAKRLKLIVDIDDIRLGLETAMPCGLILNELMTNSLKYAFPDGRAGKIEIGLRPKVGRNLELSYWDDGCGFGERASKTQPGFGLQLVRDLAYQLGGSMKISDAQSTVTLYFEGGSQDRIPAA